jgi:uncharacterized RDD family membrane protein YckC
MQCLRCGKDLGGRLGICEECNTQRNNERAAGNYFGPNGETVGAGAVPGAIRVGGARTSVGEPAGFWVRFVAYNLDCYLLGIVYLIVIFIGISVLYFLSAEGSQLKSSNFSHAIATTIASSSFLFSIFIAILPLLYNAFCESSSWRGSIGKWFIGIEVQDENGESITFLNALGRNAAKILSAIVLNIGFIIAAFTANKQALHDLMAETYVVKGERYSSSRLVIGWIIFAILTIVLCLTPFILGLLVGAALSNTSLKF